MSAVNDNIQYIDVICQHGRNGKIIPLRIRLIDEDGEYQTYTIKAYKDLTHYGDQMLDGSIVTNHIRSYDCRIQVFNCLKTIRLFYNTNEQRWRIISS